MSSQETLLDTSNKRRRIEQHSLRAKRRRLHAGSAEERSLSFWDGLSKVWLTKDALRELDRRNSRVQLADRPVTRKFLAEQRNRLHPRRHTQTAAELLHACNLEGLKTIKRFARSGGIDLRDLRGYPEPVGPDSQQSAMSSPHSSRRSLRPSRGSSSAGVGSRSTSTTTNTTTTKGSRPKDANYQQRLIDAGCFPYGYRFPNGSKPPLPIEWDKLSQTLAQPRPSLSPSRFPEEEYERFVEEDAGAFNEDAVKDTVLPAMLRAMGASDGAQKNVWFNNMDPLVPGISRAKPDYYYGAQPELLHPRVREDLSGRIVPSTSTHFPAVPNSSMEAKGPLGTNREALLQACHVGGVGARSMTSLENYGRDTPVYHGKVSSISSTYNSGTLKIYGHSVIQPNGSGTQPHYYMHQLKGVTMTDSKKAFLHGATAFKNARDWAREVRDSAIAHANTIAAARAERPEAEEDDGEEEDGEEEDGEEEEDGGEEEDDEEEDCAAQSFAYSTLDDDNAEERKTSQEENSIERPPAKRSSRRSAGSGRRKRSQF